MIKSKASTLPIFLLLLSLSSLWLGHWNYNSSVPKNEAAVDCIPGQTPTETMRAMTQMVQDRIHSLQNPPNCSRSRRVLCKLQPGPGVADGCGFGCQIHHAAMCLAVAYATNRTLIFDSTSLQYNQKGFEGLFLPLGNSCNTWPDGQHPFWLEHKHADLVIEVDENRVLGVKRPDYLPPAIPTDLADIIIENHGDPPVWWVGQFVKYLMRAHPNLMGQLKAVEDKYRLQSLDGPIVGVQIRRTDKVLEAKLYSVQEYMSHVEKFFNKTGVSHGNKYVFLATDDPRVIRECVDNYPGYKFVADKVVSELASSTTLNSTGKMKRYSPRGLLGIISDIHVLSLCDHLVCTMTSNICRLAYELQQTRLNGGLANVNSVDTFWHFRGDDEFTAHATADHTVQSAGRPATDMKTGDVITFKDVYMAQFYEKKGYIFGFNTNTGRKGYFPQDKITRVLKKWHSFLMPLRQC